MKEDNFLAKMLKRLRKQEPPSKDGEPAKKPTMYLYMLAVLVIGVVIMMGSEFLEKQEDDSILTVAAPDDSAKTEEVETFGRNDDKTDKTITDYERSFENQIKEALETITGVSDVSVVVNVDATERKVYERNKVTQKQTTDETDREGGQRVVEDSSVDDQLVIIRSGEKEIPIIQETKKPEIRGVLIVAKGADNITVKKWIVEAVTRALDVPSHRVAVMPKK